MSPGPDQPVSTRTVLAIVAVEFAALGSLAAPLTLGLALAVGQVESTWTPEEVLSLIIAVGAACALVANPVFGMLGDRTRHRGAGRSAWVLGGVIAGVPALWCLTQADTLLGLTGWWCAAQIGFNATFAGLYGLIADEVPEADRARVSGWFGAAAVFSVVAALGLAAVMPKNPMTVMLPMPLLAIVITGAAFVHLRRLPRPAGRRAANERARLRSLASHSQYWLVWVQRAMVQLAYGIVAGYGLFFLVRRVGMDRESAATYVAVTAAAAAAISAFASVLTGRLVGRHGHYGRPIVAAVLVLTAGSAVKMVGVSEWSYLAAMLLVGAGIGMYYAVDLALVLRTVPGERAGQFLGWFNIARTLPQSFAPAIAPALLALGNGDLVGDGSQNYAALYLFGIVVALVSLLPLRHLTVTRRPAALLAPSPAP